MPTNLRQAVLVVDVPETFQPRRPWELPPTIAGGELFIKNVTLDMATGFAQCYNKRAIQLHVAERKWALVIRLSKFEWQVEDEGTPAATMVEVENQRIQAENQRIDAAEEVGREEGKNCGFHWGDQLNPFLVSQTIHVLENDHWDFQTFVENIARGLRGLIRIKPRGKGIARRAFERGFMWGFEDGLRRILAAKHFEPGVSAETPPADSAGTRLPDAKEPETSAEQSAPDSQMRVNALDPIPDDQKAGKLGIDPAAVVDKLRPAVVADKLLGPWDRG